MFDKYTVSKKNIVSIKEFGYEGLDISSKKDLMMNYQLVYIDPDLMIACNLSQCEAILKTNKQFELMPAIVAYNVTLSRSAVKNYIVYDAIKIVDLKEGDKLPFSVIRLLKKVEKESLSDKIFGRNDDPVIKRVYHILYDKGLDQFKSNAYKTIK